MYSVDDYLPTTQTDSKRRHDGTRLMKLNKVRNAIFSSGSSTFTPYKYMQGRLRVDVRHDKKKRPYAEINNTQETPRSQPATLLPCRRRRFSLRPDWPPCPFHRTGVAVCSAEQKQMRERHSVTRSVRESGGAYTCQTPDTTSPVALATTIPDRKTKPPNKPRQGPAHLCIAICNRIYSGIDRHLFRPSLRSSLACS